MKWETRDTDVVERANTEKFSKLENIVTLLRLLELFFDDVLGDMIVGYTKLYSHKEKIDISFETTNEKTWSLLLDCKMIGRRLLTPIQGLIQCLVIRSSIFFRISIFVTTNNLINETNSRSFVA